MPEKTQIKTTTRLKNLVKDIKTPISSEQLIIVRDLMYSQLTIRPYNNATKLHEKSIRWRRTADKILTDGYIYEGKACTDLTVLFIALCQALGLATRFVKVARGKLVHSIAEIELSDGWYIFDVSNTKNMPTKGTITKDLPYEDWQLWRKGRDAWDIGLMEYKSISKIV